MSAGGPSALTGYAPWRGLLDGGAILAGAPFRRGGPGALGRGVLPEGGRPFWRRSCGMGTCRLRGISLPTVTARAFTWVLHFALTNFGPGTTPLASFIQAFGVFL